MNQGGRPVVDRRTHRYGTLRPLERRRRVLDLKSTTYWLCVCDPMWGGCGREVEVRADNMASGNTRTCGQCGKRAGRTAPPNRRHGYRRMDDKRRRPLGPLQRLVMTAVARLAREDAYSLSIRRLIDTLVGMSPSAGALYTTLARLERRGFMRSAGEERASVPGRRRRLYELTGAGRTAMGEVERDEGRLDVG